VSPGQTRAFKDLQATREAMEKAGCSPRSIAAVKSGIDSIYLDRSVCMCLFVYVYSSAAVSG
jgi:hypothetical protein